MAEVKLENVRIKDLMSLLVKVSVFCDAVDLYIDEEKKTVTVQPIIPSEGKLDTDERSDLSKLN